MSDTPVEGAPATPQQPDSIVVRTLRGLFDANQRMSWRRLAVFFTATGIFTLTDKLTPEQWVMVALAYIGGDALEKGLSKLGITS